MNSLEIKDLSFSYKNKEILKDVSFSIKRGSFFILLGLNGAGKSTIFALITRLLKLQKGEIFIDNHPIKNYQKALKNIGIVYQEPTLDLDLTIRQNLYYYGSLKGLSFKESISSIKEELIKLELFDKLDTITRDLNGGHRRRVEIARAMIGSVKLLLLDEPTVGLDVKSKMEILEYIKSLVKKRDLSVLWITHLFDEVGLDDSVAIIKRGRVVENSKASEILQKYEKTSIDEVFRYINKEDL